MGMPRAFGHLYPPSESTGIGLPISAGDEVIPNRSVSYSVSGSREETREKPVLGTPRGFDQKPESQGQHRKAIGRKVQASM